MTRANGTPDSENFVQFKKHLRLANPALALADKVFSVPTSTGTEAAAVVRYDPREGCFISSSRPNTSTLSKLANHIGPQSSLLPLRV